MLMSNEAIIDDLDTQLGQLRSRKDFLDDLRLKLPSDDMMKYYASFMYSRSLQDLIFEKNANISRERERLQVKLIEDKEDIDGMTKVCREAIDEFQNIGLQTFEELEASITKDSAKD